MSYVLTLWLELNLCLIKFASCVVRIEGRELYANLHLLDMQDFDVILGIDWLFVHYVKVHCREKMVNFEIPGETPFKFYGGGKYAPLRVIFAIKTRRLLRIGCKRYIAIVIDTKIE